MHTYQSKIKLHHTDAAGVLFFAHQFQLIHDGYESLMEYWGFSLADLLSKSKEFIVIIHAESDYKKPLGVGDLIEMHLRIVKVGDSSFTIAYDIYDAGGELVGTAKTVHVSVSKVKKTKILLPKRLKSQLDAMYKEDKKPARR